MPVLVDDQGTILAGHGRVLAARQLGFSDVPVVVARGCSDAKRRAYIIEDNKRDGIAELLLDVDADGPRNTSYGAFSATWSDWRRSASRQCWISKAQSSNRSSETLATTSALYADKRRV
jgi:hypothetical protein